MESNSKDKYKTVVSGGELFNDAVEILAKEIHKQYRIDQEKIKKPDDPVMQSWENQREDLKESNRKQAAQITEKLYKIGFNLKSSIMDILHWQNK